MVTDNPILEQENVKSCLEPIVSRLYDAVEKGFDTYYRSENYSKQARAEHRKRTAANCVYDHVERCLYDLVGDIPELIPLKKNGLVVFIYRDAVVLRLKKVDVEGHSKNFLTQQQKDYREQLSLEGIPDKAVRVTLGYELDVAGVGLKRVVISREVGNGVLWTARIARNDEKHVIWEDITPERLPGTEETDFRSRKRK